MKFVLTFSRVCGIQLSWFHLVLTALFFQGSKRMPAKLIKRSLKEQAETALRDMIISHRFTPGKRINVERLAVELGVSRTPVWQALKDLKAEGLVDHIPNRGMVMAQMTLDMARDLYLVREPLEALAARLAAERISKPQIRRLESLLKEQRKCLLSQDLLKYSTSDFEFHAVIYSASGNWILIDLLDNIKRRSRPFVCDISSVLSELCEDHREVLEAFKERNPERAWKTMSRHNQRMGRVIEEALSTCPAQEPAGRKH